MVGRAHRRRPPHQRLRRLCGPAPQDGRALDPRRYRDVQRPQRPLRERVSAQVPAVAQPLARRRHRPLLWAARRYPLHPVVQLGLWCASPLSRRVEARHGRLPPRPPPRRGTQARHAPPRAQGRRRAEDARHRVRPGGQGRLSPPWANPLAAWANPLAAWANPSCGLGQPLLVLWPGPTLSQPWEGARGGVREHEAARARTQGM
mmetsp:Transcript_15858/g.47684  ORF Transcript_15858/g.47684 Transcript_15858/m.47684 type:complete len:204 (-) Transcript_15858:224-835(-)